MLCDSSPDSAWTSGVAPSTFTVPSVPPVSSTIVTAPGGEVDRTTLVVVDRLKPADSTSTRYVPGGWLRKENEPSLDVRTLCEAFVSTFVIVTTAFATGAPLLFVMRPERLP